MSATRKASGQNLGGLGQSHSAMGHLMPRESDSQCPDCAHQILDFADDRASARTQVMLSMREFPILPPDAVDIITRSRNRLKQLTAKKIEAEHPNRALYL
jgi:hypothetical protein